MGQSVSSVFDDTVFSNFAMASQKLSSQQNYRQNLWKCTKMCRYYASGCYPTWDARARKVIVRPPNPFDLVSQSTQGPGIHWPILFFVMALDRDVNYNLTFQIDVDANVDVMLRHLCREIVESSVAKEDEEEEDALSHAKRLKSMSLETAARIVATAIFKSFVRHSAMMTRFYPSPEALHPDDENARQVTERRIEDVSEILRFSRTKRDVKRFVKTINEAIDVYAKEVA